MTDGKWGYRSVIFSLAAVLIFTAGCGKAQKEREITPFTIAFQEWVGYSLFYLAKDKGFFEEEGIQLIVIDEELDSARRDAFLSGMLDAEAATMDLLISKRAQGTPIVGVMQIDLSVGSDGVIASENIRRIEDLAGKRVILTRKDVGETFLSYVLDEKGMTLDDVIIVPLGPSKIAGAFMEGKGDAAVTWEPELSRALQRPGSHVLVTTKEKPGIIVDMLNVRQDIVRRDPALIKKIIRAWFRALAEYERDPESAARILAPYYGLTPEEFQRQASGLQWPGYKEQADLFKKGEMAQIFNRIAKLKLENRSIDAEVVAEDALNGNILLEVYEDSK